jgi:hypothetical protein
MKKWHDMPVPGGKNAVMAIMTCPFPSPRDGLLLTCHGADFSRLRFSYYIAMPVQVFRGIMMCLFENDQEPCFLA